MDNSTRSYIIECHNAQQADTFRLKQWFGDSVTGSGPGANDLVIDLTEAQVTGLNRDYGITARPAPAHA
jgi:hypothetical protein